MRTLLAILLLTGIGAAKAQEQVSVTAGISRDSYLISSTFSGAEIVVFGGIEALSGGVIANREGLNIAIIVIGPEQTLSVRRKEQVAGIWVNRTVERFQGVPSFYYLAATAPLNKLATREILTQRSIGLEAVAKKTGGGVDNFRDAILRAKVKSGLYVEEVGGVAFLSSSIFRATIALPAQVPIGAYTIKVLAFRNGALAGAASVPFAIDKIGLERWTFNFANNYAWAYAALAILGALLAGWLSSLAFRERR
jgi:uncharacterized protein (TIGR02186 family)